MARKESIIHQVFSKFDAIRRQGESKHEAKRNERLRCEAKGEKWNPARVPGVFSKGTEKDYKKHSLDFARWARDEYGCKNLEQANKHASEWLQKNIDSKKNSASTIHLKASALAKLYDCRSTDFGVKIPERHRKDITRSRLSREHDRHFSKTKNADLINFCKGTGLRRKEITALQAKDIYKGENGRVFVHVEKGKGGRQREVEVVKSFEKHIWNCRQVAADRESRGDHDSTKYNAKVFEKILNRADIHSYRRDYAQLKYEELLAKRDPGDRYKSIYTRRDDKKVFDRDVLKELTEYMGHSRVGVIVGHYLD